MRHLSWLVVAVLVLPVRADLIVKRKPMFPTTGCTLPSWVANVTFALSCEDAFTEGTSWPQAADYTIDDYDGVDGKDFTPDANLTMTRTTGGTGEHIQMNDATPDLAGLAAIHAKGASERYDYDCDPNTCVNFGEFRIGFILRWISAGSPTGNDPEIIKLFASSSTTVVSVRLQDAASDSDGDKNVRFVLTADNSPDDTEEVSTTGEPIVVGGTYFIEVAGDTNNAGATDVLKIYIDGSEAASNTSADLGTVQDSNLRNLSFGFVSGSNATNELMLDAIFIVNSLTPDLYADVCGDVLPCTGGQQGMYCRP